MPTHWCFKGLSTTCENISVSNVVLQTHGPNFEHRTHTFHVQRWFNNHLRKHKQPSMVGYSDDRHHSSVAVRGVGPSADVDRTRNHIVLSCILYIIFPLHSTFALPCRIALHFALAIAFEITLETVLKYRIAFHITFEFAFEITVAVSVVLPPYFARVIVALRRPIRIQCIYIYI